MKKEYRKFSFIIIVLILFNCVSCTFKTFQNDTFYAIKVGEGILNNGVDMLDHFSIHNLTYVYPHWLFDLIVFLLYKIGGFKILYCFSILAYFILGLLIYFLNKNLTKNYFVSGFLALTSVGLLGGFIAVRAQIVTYILFILEMFFIEKFLKTNDKKYLIAFPIISILIANMHCAVWPFFYILFIPVIVEQLICIYKDKKINTRFFKKDKGRFLSCSEDINFLNNKIELIKNPNFKWLILIALICLLTGFITLNGTTIFTYLIQTLKGDTTTWIMEHQPSVIYNNIPLLFMLILFIFSLLFLKTKIRLRELFLMVGLFILSFSSNRHVALLIICGSFVINRMLSEHIKEYDYRLDDLLVKKIMNKKIMILTITLIIMISLANYFKQNIYKQEYVDSKLYPVEASNYILENLDIKKIRLFNEYNYGSYLLYRGIPVFIDSRVDLYTKEFNKNLKRNITDDFLNINLNYKEVFEYYNITHAIVYKYNEEFNKSVLYEILSLNNNYKLLYEDKSFAIFEIKNN